MKFLLRVIVIAEECVARLQRSIYTYGLSCRFFELPRNDKVVFLYVLWIPAFAGVARRIAGMMLLFLGITLNSAYAQTKPVIAVNQFVNHVALDAAYEGLQKGLSDREILPGKAEIMFSNAQGNISNSVQISKHQASFKPNFMVAIATPAAQTALKAKSADSTLAFVAITDPEAANLTGRDDVIGVTDSPPISELIEIAKKIFPDLKTIGIISNAGEINSVRVAARLETILEGSGIQLKKVMITNSSDIKAAMNKLTSEVDVIYLPQDNSVILALENIVKIGKNSKTPLIANDPSLVEHGVMLALGADYFKSGEQLGGMIADILEGKKLQGKIQKTNIKQLKINEKAAKELGITIPQEILLKAKK